MRTIAILVVLMLVFSGVLLIATSEIRDSPGEINPLVIRKATSQEISELSWGYVYNDELGLTAPNEEEIYEMYDRLYTTDWVGDSYINANTSVDLSLDPCFPAIGNQQSQGSCGAWAVIYYAYGYLEAKDNGWTKASSGNTSQLLSPAFSFNRVTNCDYDPATGRWKDHGSSMFGNAWIAEDWGISTMATFPYNQYDCAYWGSESAMRDAALHKAYASYSISTNKTTNIDTIKYLLDQGIPVFMTLGAGDVYKDFGSGHYICSSTDYIYTTINHGNCIVGYDETITEDGDVGAFRVVNSWGTGWGDAGKYWLTYEAFKENPAPGLGYFADRVDYDPEYLASISLADNYISRDHTLNFSIKNQTTTFTELWTPYFRRSWSYEVPTMPTTIVVCLDELMVKYDPVVAKEVALNIQYGTVLGNVTNYHLERYNGDYKNPTSIDIGPNGSSLPHSTPILTYAIFGDNKPDYAPISTIKIVGRVGNGSWYTSIPTVTITATDDNTGVNRTMYRIEGGNWTLYTGPFTVNPGKKMIEFYSADNSGNVEKTQYQQVKVDLNAPSSGYTKYNRTVTLRSTDTISGVDNIFYRIDGGQWNRYTGKIVFADSQPHIINFYAQDQAWNTERVRTATIK